MTELEKYSTKELLKEIISREGVGPAPETSRRHGHWDSTLIGIGADHTAEISLTRDATKELMGAACGDKDYLNWVRLG